MTETPSATCPECAAQLTPAAKFCEQCGAVLGSRSTTARGEQRPVDRAEQALRRREFGRARQVMRSVRAIFGVAAMGSVLFVVLIHLSMATEARPDPDVWIAVAWLWMLAAISIAGFALVLRAPLPWTVVAASFWTLDTASLVWTGAPVATIAIRAFFAVALWFAVSQAARIRALQAADPNLQLVRRKISDERRVQGGVAEQARTRRQEQGRARLRRLLQLAAGIVVLGGIAATAIVIALRPAKVEPTIAAFAERWQKHDLAGAAALFGEGAADRRAVVFREAMEQHGWATALPALAEAKVDHGGRFATATFSLSEGAVVVRFGSDDRGWFVTDVDLPELRPTDPAPAIEAFAKAWATKGTAALLATVRPQSRDRFGANTVRMLTNREWHEQRPQLGPADAAKPRYARVQVEFPCDRDALEVTFEYWTPNWYLTGMKLPER